MHRATDNQVVRELGELPPGTVLSVAELAKLFDRCGRSVRRAVQRGELPPPVRLFGAWVWTAGALVQHIEQRLADAADGAAQEQQRLGNLSP